MVIQEDGIASQVLHELVNLCQFPWNADVLWTMGFALSALDAVVGLSRFRYSSVESNEVLASVLPIFLVTIVMG
jgi:hypothetical protein